MERVIKLNSIDQSKHIPPLYFHLEGEHRLPVILGTGRSAVVLLATTAPDPDNPSNEYRAVKFLRNDPDEQFALSAAERFFLEAGQVQLFGKTQETFVKYWGWGSIGSKADGQFWWRSQFADVADQIPNTEAELLRLKAHFDLQGPFYVLHLCQGTLHDLLDTARPWENLPCYGLKIFRTALSSESKRIGKDIEEIARRYLERSPAGLSGYEILNSFRHDKSPDGVVANRIRNFAVLEMFAAVTDSVAKLHQHDSGEDPLAHRDLKPGNIFFEHEASSNGFNAIRIKLADLGYVTTPAGIDSGEKSLREGRKGASYLAPGSQFYRAPEQASLPIEVRVDVDLADSSVVHIKGSKLSNIEVHDWLTLSDLFGERKDNGGTTLFKIRKVDYDREQNSYRLELDHSVVSSKGGDLQGEITRATGFHTDGFSLGSILYDLISGGRDPELFYTYCLASYTSQFAHGANYTVEGILDILSPEGEGNGSESKAEHLTIAEKWRAAQQIQSAQDLDGLLNQIQDAILTQRNKVDSEAPLKLTEKLKHFRFRNFELVRELLTDWRKEPIPRAILRIIVRCMVRDAEDSYYRRDAQQGFLTLDNYKAATRITNDVRELLGQTDYTWPKEGFPHLLQNNLLFKLRSLAPQEPS